MHNLSGRRQKAQWADARFPAGAPKKVQSSELN
jgi:hypothetical protein